MKLVVFVSLLVVLIAQAESASCAGKTVEVLVANGQDLTGDGLVSPDPYVKVSCCLGYRLSIVYEHYMVNLAQGSVVFVRVSLTFL